MTRAQDATKLIKLIGVTKYYPDGDVTALQDINLVIQNGEFLTIVGPSGCGKSTLLHILGGLDLPTNGQVLFEGQSILESDLNRLRSKMVGFVFQSFYLLPNLTALENVQLPMFGTGLTPAQRVQRAERLLETVGLRQRMKHLPNQLSVGQRQRVAIARALANCPAVVLADEPTGSLDSSSGREVMDLLIRLNKEEGTALIVVTHDVDIAQRGHRQIRMLDGAIVQDVSGVASEPMTSVTGSTPGKEVHG